MLLGADRQGEDDEIERRMPREIDEIIDIAELREAGDDIGRARIRAVVENPEDVEVVAALFGEILEQFMRGLAALVERCLALCGFPRRRPNTSAPVSRGSPCLQ